MRSHSTEFGVISTERPSAKKSNFKHSNTIVSSKLASQNHLPNNDAKTIKSENIKSNQTFKNLRKIKKQETGSRAIAMNSLGAKHQSSGINAQNINKLEVLTESNSPSSNRVIKNMPGSSRRLSNSRRRNSRNSGKTSSGRASHNPSGTNNFHQMPLVNPNTKKLNRQRAPIRVNAEPIAGARLHTDLSQNTNNPNGIPVATKISVKSQLQPRYDSRPENLRIDGKTKQGPPFNLKQSLPPSFFKHVNSSSYLSNHLTILSPKSSAKKLAQQQLQRRSSKKVLPKTPSQVHLIKWNSASWPDIEEQLSFGKCLGQGSFAKVYKGIDKVYKRHVAIKVIEKARLSDDKRKTLAQKEINVLSILDHQNLCKFFRMLEDHKRVKN